MTRHFRLFLLFGISAAAVPATPLYGAKDWGDGKAEILVYDVLRPYRGDSLAEAATWITEAGFFQPRSGVFTRVPEAEGVAVLQSALRRPGQAEGLPLSALAMIRVDRSRPQARWWQHVSWHGVYGGHWRQASLSDGKVSLRAESTGGEAARASEDLKPPLVTEEMLFLYLRGLPQRRSYAEEIWLLDSQLGDKASFHAQYAKIEVVQENAMVRELAACHFRVTRDDGKKLEFWLHKQGLRPVVKARLPDGSDWTLRGWERKKYWSF